MENDATQPLMSREEADWLASLQGRAAEPEPILEGGASAAGAPLAEASLHEAPLREAPLPSTGVSLPAAEPAPVASAVPAPATAQNARPHRGRGVDSIFSSSAAPARPASAPTGFDGPVSGNSGEKPESPADSSDARPAERAAAPFSPMTGIVTRVAAGSPADARGASGVDAAALARPEQAARFLDAFFAELERCGVTDVVVSPGSRSTPLAMKALERFGDVYLDVDERGAAFFALGLAKAKGTPVVAICTSGTAVANWMPAVLEAESSRVPLILLSGDRPARLQHVGAPQTCDQLNLFGNHVRLFVNMPLPSADEATLAYARQMALECCVAAYGQMPGARSCDAAPVHVNFPFEEPLKPAPGVAPSPERRFPPTLAAAQMLSERDAFGLLGMLAGKRVIALCGEGSADTDADRQALTAFASRRSIPLLADPLSGLRASNADCVVDSYDTILADGESWAALAPEVVIRFGRWPVSKRLSTFLAQTEAVQIAVDLRDTRDFTASTDMLVRALPRAFAEGLFNVKHSATADERFALTWVEANDSASALARSIRLNPNADDFEGAYVDRVFDLAPAGSLVFCANSLSIRVADTFYAKGGNPLTVLANRGLNGIDGTLSTAFGAAQAFAQTTVIAGDLAFLHDANALALHREMMVRQARGNGVAPAIAVVLLNNNGGGIFDMLPQRSDEDYFERLFLTPQDVSFRQLAAAFGVGYRRATTVSDFKRIYTSTLGVPGISVIEVNLPLRGVPERFAPYWGAK